MNERESIRDAVSGTDLAIFELQPVAVLDTDEVAFCWEVPVADAHALWRQARSHAETLGRWPLLVLEPFSPDTFNRSFYGDTDDQSPAAVLLRAEEMTQEQVWEVYPTTPPFPWDDETWDRIAGVCLAESAARAGHAPPLTLEDSRQMRPDLDRFERVLFEWEEAERPTTATEGGGHLDWQPWFDGICGLLLMPTAHSWQVPAYTSFFGASRPLGHEALVRVMREWHERFGAELVASWGTELQFRVARPPTDVETAYELALQQAAVAESTIAGPGISVRQHARALLQRHDWYLHERP